LLAAILFSGNVFLGLAQDGSKTIKSEEYLGARPEDNAIKVTSSSASGAQAKAPAKGKKSKPPTAARSKQEPPAKAGATAESFVYVVDKNFPEGPPSRDYEYVRLGVTIWRLSASQCPIPDCPLPKRGASGGKGLLDTATRIDDNVPLGSGERIRLALESLSHRGYVYIIDREQFSDGTFGDPYLIFPTKKINDGNNWAAPGLQVHLPRPDGCFCVKARDAKKSLIADVLTVILSPTSLLAPNEIAQDAILLPPALHGLLDRADKEKTFRALLRGGNGLTMTSQEQTAGAKGLFDTAPLLSRNDLPPQAFYQSTVAVGKKAVFNVILRYDTASF
jgi:hypothetical protein